MSAASVHTGLARAFSRACARALVVIAVGALGATAVACNRGERERPVVALVLKTLNNAFFVEMERGARSVADSLGLELLVQAPEREVDVEKQMQIVENLIQRQIAVLAISPSGSREIVPAIVKAGTAKIPVVVVDTRVDMPALAAAGGSVATFIGSDNVDGGRIAGRFIAERLAGKGRIAVLEGIPGHESGDSRLRGFREALAKSPGISVVSSQTANWERDQAFNVTQNMLQSNRDVQAIFACNDVMALGAVEAIAAAGLQGKILVVGFDAQDDARSAVDAGRMAATIAQSPFAMGRLAMISASRLLKGETVPAEQPVTIQLVTAKAASAP
jgi:ribose transport system substrate-binding protein